MTCVLLEGNKHGVSIQSLINLSKTFFSNIFRTKHFTDLNLCETVWIFFFFYLFDSWLYWLNGFEDGVTVKTGNRIQFNHRHENRVSNRKPYHFSFRSVYSCLPIFTSLALGLYKDNNSSYVTGRKIAPNTAANATAFFTLATKSWKLVANLATRISNHTLPRDLVIVEDL